MTVLRFLRGPPSPPSAAAAPTAAAPAASAPAPSSRPAAVVPAASQLPSPSAGAKRASCLAAAKSGPGCRVQGQGPGGRVQWAGSSRHAAISIFEAAVTATRLQSSLLTAYRIAHLGRHRYIYTQAYTPRHGPALACDAGALQPLHDQRPYVAQRGVSSSGSCGISRCSCSLVAGWRWQCMGVLQQQLEQQPRLQGWACLTGACCQAS